MKKQEETNTKTWDQGVFLLQILQPQYTEQKRCEPAMPAHIYQERKQIT